jgi:hypothetical protein
MLRRGWKPQKKNLCERRKAIGELKMGNSFLHLMRLRLHIYTHTLVQAGNPRALHP